MLAYLAVIGRPVARDTLADLLWPDLDPDGARGALRRTLSTLRSGLHDQGLRVDRHQVAVAPEDVEVDVTAFRRAVGQAGHRHAAEESCPACRRALSRAVDLYRGDLLEGFGLRDSATFDEWQSLEGEALRGELGQALSRLVRLLDAEGRRPDAIAAARRLLALDPLDEGAHRALMRLYAAGGDRAAAVRQYRECVRVLETELAVPPTTETTQLLEALLADRSEAPRPDATVAGHQPPATRQGTAGTRATPSARRAPPSPASLPARPPLVARERELTALLEAARAPGDGRILAVVGLPGFGKSHLVEALAAARAADGVPVLAARAGSEEGPGVGVVTRLLEGSALGPEVSGEGPAWFASITDALEAASAPDGLLVIDDVDRADPPTLEWLAWLVPRLDRRRVRLAVAWTPGDGAADQVERLLLAAAGERRATVVRLDPLDVDGVEALARSLGLPADVARRLARRLAAEADGSPLLVSEYVAAVKAGELDAARPDGWRVPGGVRGLVEARLAALTDVARQLLDTAAVLGEVVDPELARGVGGRPEVEAAAGFDELVRRGLLREAPPGQPPVYAFANGLVRRIVLDALGLARRRILHRRAAQMLEAGLHGAAPGAGTAASIAAHLAAAGLEAEAGRYHVLAAEAARRLAAHADAVDHLRAAVALGHPAALDLHETIGDLETLRGRYGEALVAYEVAAALVSPDDVERLARLEHRLGGLHLRRGALELADLHLEAALARIAGTETATRARLLADRALVAVRRGHLDVGERLARSSLRAAREGRDAEAESQAENLLAMLARRRGRLDAARRHLRRSLEQAAAARHGGGQVAALNNLALLEREAGEPERALALTDDALRRCLVLGDRHREAALRNNRADLLHALGRPAEAIEELRRSVEAFAEIGERPEMEPEIWKLVEW